MNSAQVSGITKNLMGKFQEKAGKFLGNREQQMTGLQKQHMAKTETDLGNARELIKNAIRQMQKSKRAMNSHRITT
ncbi:MAG: CsbD family protein [Candidatus Magasanikbacteria bacterium]|nr:CsbD family protein [Candidatus Magasanikbacteria bacterium]